MFIDKFVRFLPKSGLKKALHHFNKGEHGKSCRAFESYLTRIADEPAAQDHEMVRMYMVESYIEYARELSAKGGHKEASEQLERAIALQPGYADVHFSLGMLYDLLGRTADARDSLKKALTINPNYFRARVKLAQCYHSDGNVENTVTELEASYAAAPNFFIEQVKKLISLVRTGSNPEEQDMLFHQLLEEKPSSSQVSKQIALEAIQNGDYDYAQAELKKSLTLHPNYPDLHNLLGIAYANKGMSDDAIIEFETALKIHPDYLKARLNLALTLYEKGSLDDSMKNLKIVLELDPENELAKNLLKELQPVPEGI